MSNKQYLENDEFELDDDFNLEVLSDDVMDSETEDNLIPLDKSEVKDEFENDLNIEVPINGLKDAVENIEVDEINSFFGITTPNQEFKEEVVEKKEKEIIEKVDLKKLFLEKFKKKEKIIENKSEEIELKKPNIVIEKLKSFSQYFVIIGIFLAILIIFTIAFTSFFNEKPVDKIDKSPIETTKPEEDVIGKIEDDIQTETTNENIEATEETTTEVVVNQVKNPVYRVVNFGEGFLNKNYLLNHESLGYYEEYEKGLLSPNQYATELKKVISEKQSLFDSVKDESIINYFTENKATEYYKTIFNSVENTLKQDKAILEVLSRNEDRTKVIQIISIAKENEKNHLIDAQIELMDYLTQNNISYKLSETDPKYDNYFVKLKDINFTIEEYLK